jgi:hypothetical protein
MEPRPGLASRPGLEGDVSCELIEDEKSNFKTKEAYKNQA